MTPEEFRALGHRIVDWIAEYRASIESRPVMSKVAPGAIKAMLPASPPIEGGTLGGIVDDLERVVMPGVTHWNHPAFFAYFPSNSGLASVLADLLSSGLGVQGMSWQTSPAATEVEEVMLDWLRQALDLPPHFSGVIQDTASTATLIALLSARERRKDRRAPLAVYTSKEAHSSVEKAARLAGFDPALLRFIETDEAYAMEASALERRVAEDEKAGIVPCAIVATIGTTATTAIDPLFAVSEIAARSGAWLHVDAAMAGSAMILPECRWMWRGVGAADSLVLNPHKWLGVAFDLTAYYVRDPRQLIQVMSTDPSYLKTSADGQVKNLRDWGIALGRRFRALKLWFLFRDLGLVGLQARLRRDLENAQWLKDQVDQTPDWRRVAPVPLQTVCVRHVPPGMSEEQADLHNAAWVDALNRSGQAYLTPALVGGRRIVRVSIGAELTERRHVEALWSRMKAAAG